MSANSEILGNKGSKHSFEHAGKTYTVSCAPNFSTGSIWGADTYTDDSNICTAAVHAGVITFGAGGPVTFKMTVGLSVWPGTTRNNVTSNYWGSTWYNGYSFVTNVQSNAQTISQLASVISALQQQLNSLTNNPR